MAMSEIATEYMELDVKNSLGMSYLEYLKLPYFIKEELKAAIIKRMQAKKRVEKIVEKEEEKKRDKKYNNLGGRL